MTTRRTFLLGLCAAPVAAVAVRYFPEADAPSWLGVDLASEPSTSGLAILMRAADEQSRAMMAARSAVGRNVAMAWYDLCAMTEFRDTWYVGYSDGTVAELAEPATW